MRILSGPHILVGLLLGVFLALSITSLHHRSLTYDEPAHYSYSKQILSTGNTDRIGNDDSKMPVSILNVLPHAVGLQLPKGKLQDYFLKIETGRIATIIIGVLFGVLIFRWTKLLYGTQSALLALFLYCFSPNIIAHTRLITTDTYASVTFLWAFYRYYLLLKRPDWKNGFWGAFSFSVAQIAKYSGVFLIALFVCIALLKYCICIFKWYKSNTSKLHTVFHPVKLFTVYVLVYLVMWVSVTNVAYLFNDPLIPFKELKVQSSTLLKLQGNKLLSNLPITFPKPYVQGIDRVLYRSGTGSHISPIYLNRELRRLEPNGGFTGYKSYYFISFIYKVPIATLIVFFSAIVFFVIGFFQNKSSEKSTFMDKEIFLLVPIGFHFIYYNFFYSVQIGFRFFLPVMAFVFIFSARCIRESQYSFRTWRSYVCLSCLGGYLLCSVLSYHPHYLPYFNELVLDRKKNWHVLSDSNIDWNQNVWYYLQYKKKNPGVKDAIPNKPEAGKLIVGVNPLTGVYLAKPNDFSWLRNNFEPVDHVGYSYIVYDITEEDLLNKGFLKK